MQTSRDARIHASTATSLPRAGKWRSRSAAHRARRDAGALRPGLPLDLPHRRPLLLKRQRISDICNGVIERGLKFTGAARAVDSVGVDYLALMGRAPLRHAGVRRRGRDAEDARRLAKKQTLTQVEHAVRQAKKHGIAGSTASSSSAAPARAPRTSAKPSASRARLELDTSVSTGGRVPGNPALERVRRPGIIDEDRTGTRRSSAATSILTPSRRRGEQLRMKGYASLLLRRILVHPLRTWDLLGRSAGTWRGETCQAHHGPFRTKAASVPPCSQDGRCGLRAPTREARRSRDWEGAALAAPRDATDRDRALAVRCCAARTSPGAAGRRTRRGRRVVAEEGNG